METNPIRVLIVDDSMVIREHLQHIIESDPGLKVVGMCQDGIEALHWLTTNSADVITMDIVMPIMDGFEVTRKIMETKPTPIIVITSIFKAKDAILSFKALEAGALAILEKPLGPTDSQYNDKVAEIIATIRIVKEIKLIKKRTSPQKFQQSTPILNEKNVEYLDEVQAVVIGASLGGPAALVSILSNLSVEFPVPIFIVQHIVSGFTAGLATWLQSSTNLPVVIPKHGEIPKKGYCYIAPDNCHMIISKGNVIHLEESSKKGIQQSVAALFKCNFSKTHGAAGLKPSLRSCFKPAAP
jgi:two-component system chemotaxis response regulator CheB